MAGTDMVGLGLSVFAIGAVAGWSALFLRWPVTILSALGLFGIGLIWLMPVPVLALRISLPLSPFYAGFGLGAAAHAALRAAIPTRGTVR
ncbi:hypothetical protein [Sandarakinorhabdus glacialis]|uniref:hypothetical protein n=1 Tax=Sandarakinorhabdus glacialis TaxID=1614636 RepID=UPI001669FAC0|nr:hypothetical protein [Polymorphobacter glacialis]